MGQMNNETEIKGGPENTTASQPYCYKGLQREGKLENNTGTGSVGGNWDGMVSS